MKIRPDVEYQIANTLLGKKIYVGIKEANSFIQFDSKYINSVINLIENEKETGIEELKQLSGIDNQLIDVFEQKGFCNNGKEPEKSFNEFKGIGKEWFNIYIKKQGILNHKIFIYMEILLLLVSICIISINRNMLTNKIDYMNMEIWEIVVSIILGLILMLGLHECGHCIAAQTVGIEIRKISIGFYMICPIIVVSYQGMHLHNTCKKIWVELGGVFMNMFLTAIGIIIKLLGVHSTINDIWIMANISMIITNIEFFGMTDGYFVLTSLTGLTNIRLLGYKYLKKIIRSKSRKLIKKKEVISGVILLISFVLSFVGIIIQIWYIGTLFSFNTMILKIVSLIIIIILILRLIYKIALLKL